MAKQGMEDVMSLRATADKARARKLQHENAHHLLNCIKVPMAKAAIFGHLYYYVAHTVLAARGCVIPDDFPGGLFNTVEFGCLNITRDGFKFRVDFLTHAEYMALLGQEDSHGIVSREC